MVLFGAEAVGRLRMASARRGVILGLGQTMAPEGKVRVSCAVGAVRLDHFVNALSAQSKNFSSALPVRFGAGCAAFGCSNEELRRSRGGR